MMRLFLCLVFIGLNSYSQVVNLGTKGILINSSLNRLTNSLDLYFDDHVEHFDLETFRLTVDSLYPAENLDRSPDLVLADRLVHIGGQPYFVNNAGGMVYVLENDTLRRIDRSFNHLMQNGSWIFTYDDKILKYGGYGFWSNRDFFIFFDPEKIEWDIYKEVRSKRIPAGIQGAMGIQDNDEIHLFGGSIMNPYNRKEWLMNDEIWSFNFNTLQWHFLGNTEPLPNPYKSVAYDDKMILIYTNELVRIDVKGNKKTEFQLSSSTSQIKAAALVSHFNDKFYVLINASRTLLIIDEEDFFGPVISENRLYTNPSYWMGISVRLLVSALMLALAVWLLVKWLRKRNKVQVLENGLRYKNKFVEFDKRQIQVLQLLINHLEVPSGDILALVEREQYSPAHNERLKVQLVKDVNLKLKALFGEHDDLIKNFKSRKDRRIRVYKISRQYF